MSRPLLSVCLIIYNHVNYIRDAIEGVLMQKVNFNWELIIADDFSIDGTRELILEYKNKYPDFITLILQEKNVGAAQNWIDLITKPISKYIAYFEGDDYWTDPLKLQKQVDFLEGNPDFSLSFHNALIKWEDDSLPDKLFCPPNQKEISTIDDVIKGWFIPSASMVFRTEVIRPLPNWFKTIYNGDYALHLLAAYKGKIGYINKPMAIYRKANGSLSFSVGQNIEYINSQIINLLKLINLHTYLRFELLINERINKIEKETKMYLLKKKSKILYWIINPKKVIKKIGLKLFIIAQYQG